MKKMILWIIPLILLAEEKTLSSVLVADGSKKPVFVTSYPNDSKLLYVVEQAGLIRIIKNGKKLKKRREKQYQETNKIKSQERSLKCEQY